METGVTIEFPDDTRISFSSARAGCPRTYATWATRQRGSSVA
jgi:hypothetical protein